MTDIWTGTAGSWDDHFNWSTNAVPTSADDVEIDETASNGGAPSIYGYAAVANSVMIGANQTGTGIGFGGSLTITAGLTLGVDSSIGLSGAGAAFRWAASFSTTASLMQLSERSRSVRRSMSAPPARS